MRQRAACAHTKPATIILHESSLPQSDLRPLPIDHRRPQRWYATAAPMLGEGIVRARWAMSCTHTLGNDTRPGRIYARNLRGKATFTPADHTAPDTKLHRLRRIHTKVN